jgi:FkbM family methyltransferase
MISRLFSYLRKRHASEEAPTHAPESRQTGAALMPHAKTEPFFDCLKKIGFAPQHIVDIGANRGNWTRTALRFFPDSQNTLFEPQENLLKNSDLSHMSNVSIYAMGVGESSGLMKMSMHERDDSFSFSLSPEQAAAAGRKQIDIPVVKLDEFFLSKSLLSADILKIDAEGWDLEVLRGGKAVVSEASVVLLEAAVLNKTFKNTIDKVILEMRDLGFKVFDITDLNRTARHNALWLVEIAFVKKDSHLDNAVRTYA